MLDVYDVFSDAESVVFCCHRVTVSLFSRHDIRTQDGRLSQPQPRKHSRKHGARHEGSPALTVSLLSTLGSHVTAIFRLA